MRVQHSKRSGRRMTSWGTICAEPPPLRCDSPFLEATLPSGRRDNGPPADNRLRGLVLAFWRSISYERLVDRQPCRPLRDNGLDHWFLIGIRHYVNNGDRDRLLRFGSPRGRARDSEQYPMLWRTFSATMKVIPIRLHFPPFGTHLFGFLHENSTARSRSRESR